MKAIRILISILLSFFSVVAVMKLLTSLNKGNLIYNTIAIVGLFFVVYFTIRTKCYTNFNFKTKKDEENS